MMHPSGYPAWTDIARLWDRAWWRSVTLACVEKRPQATTDKLHSEATRTSNFRPARSVSGVFSR
jgi:hypothetical protein